MQRESLIVAADCTLIANPELPQRYHKGETVVIGCPLLENPDRLAEKIDLIMGESRVKHIEVYTMEVPCCYAIHMMVDRSVKKRKKEIDIKNFIVRAMTGEIEPYTFGRLDMSMIEMERKVHG